MDIQQTELNAFAIQANNLLSDHIRIVAGFDFESTIIGPEID